MTLKLRVVVTSKREGGDLEGMGWAEGSVTGCCLISW